jgi:hypothetical protein
MNSAKFKSHTEVACGQLFREIRRGWGEFHLTVLAPKELNANPAVRLDTAKAAAAASATAAAASIVEVGLGRVEQAATVDGGNSGGGSGDGGGGGGEVEWALYLVFEWPWADQFRATLGLPSKDFHVTLAFSADDIHDVPKDATTCKW